jgi:hypothetical protein
VSDGDDILERTVTPALLRVPTLITPAMERVSEFARETLRERGLTKERIEKELAGRPEAG